MNIFVEIVKNRKVVDLGWFGSDFGSKIFCVVVVLGKGRGVWEVEGGDNLVLVFRL